jgi:signal transduction histidine kinase
VVEGGAHEVRNCLTSLGGFAHRLRKVTTGNPDAEQFTKIILDDVERLERMVWQIEDYLRFSKFYSFRFDTVDVPEVIGKAHDRVLSEVPPATKIAVAFTMKTPKNLPEITADPSAVEEIFYNLLLNAYEAMPSGGRLTVTVKNLTSAVSVAIADTGVGIRTEDLSEIFTPFFTSKMSGAGMGLSKVYLLVEEHRGSVSVSSDPAKGSVFEVVLPVERRMTGLYAGEAAARSRPVK